MYPTIEYNHYFMMLSGSAGFPRRSIATPGSSFLNARSAPENKAWCNEAQGISNT